METIVVKANLKVNRLKVNRCNYSDLNAIFIDMKISLKKLKYKMLWKLHPVDMLYAISRDVFTIKFYFQLVRYKMGKQQASVKISKILTEILSEVSVLICEIVTDFV